jgi:UPF0176 protein
MYVNIAAYKFINFKKYSVACGGDKNYGGFQRGRSDASLPLVMGGDSFPVHDYYLNSLECGHLKNLCKQIKQVALSQSIKGTVLLSTEGINLFLSGEKDSISYFQSFLKDFSHLNDLVYKYSYSDFVPFKKLCVKIRKEIVTFQQEGISPEKHTAPYLSPDELKNWIDHNKDCILLDTRNAFEYKLGAFINAVHLEINTFRELPDALQQSDLDNTKPIITYCTGGIRSEKAAAYLLENGFKEVYQLQGGILNYFECCGGQYYQGDCFVFDDRIALNNKLEPIDN